MPHMTAMPTTLRVYALCFGIVLTTGLAAVRPARGHELWIEADSQAQPNADCRIDVCWGHSGERAGGPALDAMASRVTALAKAPNGSIQAVSLATKQDCLSGQATLGTPGVYAIGAKLETGIIDREVHGIPAKTRIVMTGQTSIRVGQESSRPADVVGFDLEIILLTEPENLRPGNLVTAKILFHGKPLGGRNALVSLGTAGMPSPNEETDADACQWTIEAHADPRTGEVCFPLIAAGRHEFLIRFLDETPGRYEGELDFNSEFSHLRKGDAYEQTMHVATLTFDVKGE